MVQIHFPQLGKGVKVAISPSLSWSGAGCIPEPCSDRHAYLPPSTLQIHVPIYHLQRIIIILPLAPVVRNINILTPMWCELTSPRQKYHLMPSFKIYVMYIIYEEKKIDFRHHWCCITKCCIRSFWMKLFSRNYVLTSIKYVRKIAYEKGLEWQYITKKYRTQLTTPKILKRYEISDSTIQTREPCGKAQQRHKNSFKKA